MVKNKTKKILFDIISTNTELLNRDCSHFFSMWEHAKRKLQSLIVRSGFVV